jgi:hypothetical protein
MSKAAASLLKDLIRRYFYAVINKFTLPEGHLSRAYPQDVVDRFFVRDMLGSLP